MKATVLSYCRKKGWGFALPDDGSNDVFIHRNNLPNSRKFVAEGDEIEYTLGERNRRPIALNIQFVSIATTDNSKPVAAPASPTLPFENNGDSHE